MMFNPKINATLTKGGNSYVFRIPKALIDTEILHEGRQYRVVVEEIEPEVERPRRDSNPVSEFWEEYERYEPSDRNRAVEQAIHSHEHALTA